MRHPSGLRFAAAVLVWLPVGLALSAASCETDRERSDREFRERMMAEQQMQQMMQWNAFRQQQLAEQAKQQQLPPPPGANPPNTRTGRNQQELRIEVRVKE